MGLTMTSVSRVSADMGVTAMRRVPNIAYMDKSQKEHGQYA
jgi:hypothetical protein